MLSTMTRGYLGTSVIGGILLVLPFVILELINTGGFPPPLFVAMWFLSFCFILLARPVVRAVRVGNSKDVRPVGLLSRVVGLILIGSLWVDLVLDQMPCFLGVPNCD